MDLRRLAEIMIFQFLKFFKSCLMSTFFNVHRVHHLTHFSSCGSLLYEDDNVLVEWPFKGAIDHQHSCHSVLLRVPRSVETGKNSSQPIFPKASKAVFLNSTYFYANSSLQRLEFVLRLSLHNIVL